MVGMTAATSGARSDASVIGLIGAGHFLSHFFIFVLPPLLPLLKEEFGVGYAALGLAITLFNVTSGLAQTPAGFLVDRIGPRALLLGGVALGAACFAGMALIPTYGALLAFAALAGIANSVYHPADYAVLSAAVGGKRMGRAFSLHTFAGYAGGAAAPLVMAVAVQLWDWRAGMLLTALLGFAVFAVLLAGRAQLVGPRPAATAGATANKGARESGVRLLLSTPILMCFAFFVLISMSAGDISGFSVAAFIDVHQLALSDAQLALTGFLVGNAAGILVGGWIADRTVHHERVAMGGFLATAVIIFLIGQSQWGAAGILLAMSAGGLLYGLIMPSRDMLVRAVTPEGQTGKVFGFVTTGFNVGGILTPLLFGWILDAGEARWLFWLAPAFMLIAAGTVLATRAVQTSAAARPASRRV